MLRSVSHLPGLHRPLPADISPLFVVTYVEAKPTSRDEAAALLKAYRDTSRKTPGNARSLVVQSAHRPGQFVVVSAWQNKADMGRPSGSLKHN